MHPFQRLLPAAIILLSIVVIGVAGYMAIEHWSFLDAVYMVAITLSTTGFQEVHPLSQTGRMFTVLIVVTGVGTTLYAAVRAVEIIVEGEMVGYQKRKRMKSLIKDMRNHYIICGFGRVGHQVAEAFDGARLPYVVIDGKPETIDELDARGIPSIIGDVTSDDILNEAGIKVARALVACSDSDVANVYVTLSARALNPNVFIVARSALKDTEKKLMMAGANRVISPYFISGSRMAALATRPVTSDFLDLVTHGGHVDFQLYELSVEEGSSLIGKSLESADITRVVGASILAIRKADGRFDLQPRASSKIDKNDVLLVIGTQEQFERLVKLVNQS
jgi:voltage-gated potassium channel